MGNRWEIVIVCVQLAIERRTEDSRGQGQRVAVRNTQCDFRGECVYLHWTCRHACRFTISILNDEICIANYGFCINDDEFRKALRRPAAAQQCHWNQGPVSTRIRHHNAISRRLFLWQRAALLWLQHGPLCRAYQLDERSSVAAPRPTYHTRRWWHATGWTPLQLGQQHHHSNPGKAIHRSTEAILPKRVADQKRPKRLPVLTPFCSNLTPLDLIVYRRGSATQATTRW